MYCTLCNANVQNRFFSIAYVIWYIYLISLFLLEFNVPSSKATSLSQMSLAFCYDYFSFILYYACLKQIYFQKFSQAFTFSTRCKASQIQCFEDTIFRVDKMINYKMNMNRTFIYLLYNILFCTQTFSCESSSY